MKEGSIIEITPLRDLFMRIRCTVTLDRFNEEPQISVQQLGLVLGRRDKNICNVQLLVVVLVVLGTKEIFIKLASNQLRSSSRAPARARYNPTGKANDT